MTIQEKQIKLAEWAGFTDITLGYGAVTGCAFLRGTLDGIPFSLVPDYFNSLDAVAQLEKKLKNQFPDTIERYWRSLEHIQPHLIFATAYQRAEELGVILELWKEGE